MRQVRVHSDHVRCVAYSPDGKLLATAGNDGRVCLLDAITGQTGTTWGGLEGIMQSVTFSPDGRYVAFGGQTNYLLIGDFAPSLLLEAAPIPGSYGEAITALAYVDPDTILVGVGDRILKASHGGLFVYRVSTRTFTPHYQSWGVSHLTLRPDRHRLAMVTSDGLCFAAAPTWKPDDPLGGGYAMAVSYSPDGKTLAAAHGWKAILLDAETYEVRHELAHRGRVTSIAFTPDGRTLLTGSWDKTIGVWSAAGGTLLSALDWGRGKVQYVAAAPDGMTAAAACDRGVVIWDLD
jgi:WD40 repeat protein